MVRCKNTGCPVSVADGFVERERLLMLEKMVLPVVGRQIHLTFTNRNGNRSESVGELIYDPNTKWFGVREEIFHLCDITGIVWDDFANRLPRFVVR